MTFSKVSAVSGQKSVKQYVVASLFGSALEWYDFFLYATAASLVLGKLFFPPDTDPLVATMGAFAGFAVGFAARPIGGIIFGHIGDKISRKTSLVLTLSIMGAATFIMGLLPTYAQIGIFAPILLLVLRVVQGIAAGGEWGGGVLLISENTGSSRRGLLSAFSQSGVSLGFVLSAGAFFLVQLLPEEQFLSWGWRLPFLLSVLIFGVGMYIRFRLPDNQDFKKGDAQATSHRLPFIEAIKTHPKEILVGMGLRVAENGGSYLFLSFSIVYGVHVGVDRGILLAGVMLSMLFSFGMTLFFGHLSDKIGRRKVYAFGAVMLVVIAFPFFAMIGSNSNTLVILAYFIANGVCHAAMIGTQPAFFHELFDAKIRYSGMSIAHEVAAVFAGGLAPLIATALLIKFDSYVPVAIYAIGLACITLLALALSGKVGDMRPARSEDSTAKSPVALDTLGTGTNK
ncbi:MFS transporter [Paeniglutamicibacter psychrophenolicus]|uniref:MFS family permease n=1 Tax=Paeniglutamicibacter psychrophenolicus TaxID=257454 RepID=A0ABS4WBD2_9MICC|nr:MFS transporter [Paeniglutamicibacter psychrophenolicus]MBP2373519.1 MFS family permease [Paeniglutamicibacter psychrophenolicus]